MADISPINRTMLQKLKSTKDKEIQNKFIQLTVDTIYKQVISLAKTSTITYFHHLIPYGNGALECDERYTSNMDDILLKLEKLFLDCSVTQKKIAYSASEQKIYDITDIAYNLISQNPQLNRYFKQRSAIVIDWS